MPTSLLQLHDLLARQEDNMLACIRCGLCLSVCPTYQLTQLEPESPRGRIAIARALHEGFLTITPDLIRHEESCLLCEACTAICPAGVKMDLLGMALRPLLEQARRRPLLERLVRRMGFALLANLGALRAALRLVRWTGPLRSLARRLGLLRLLRLERAEALLPPLSGPFLVPRGQVWPALGAEKGRVALFAGCIMSTIFAEVDRATARVLRASGWTVVVPPGQGCCGALHGHEGHWAAAQELARRTVEAFEQVEAEAVIVNAAGCGSMLKAYDAVLADDPTYAARAATFAARVRDVTEFLAEHGLGPGLAPLERTVTYQEPCHLAHAQRIREAPRLLLRQVPGLQLIEMKESSLCCGSAGIYNLTHAATATALGERKARNALATGAQTVVTANPGCHLQLRAMLDRVGAREVVVRHVVELLDEAYRQGGVYTSLRQMSSFTPHKSE